MSNDILIPILAFFAAWLGILSKSLWGVNKDVFKQMDKDREATNNRFYQMDHDITDKLNVQNVLYTKFRSEFDMFMKNLSEGLLEFLHHTDDRFGIDDIADAHKKIYKEYDTREDLSMEDWRALVEKCEIALVRDKQENNPEKKLPDMEKFALIILRRISIHKLMGFPKERANEAAQA